MYTHTPRESPFPRKYDSPITIRNKEIKLPRSSYRTLRHGRPPGLLPHHSLSPQPRTLPCWSRVGYLSSTTHARRLHVVDKPSRHLASPNRTGSSFLECSLLASPPSVRASFLLPSFLHQIAPAPGLLPIFTTNCCSLLSPSFTAHWLLESCLLLLSS